MTLLKRFNNLNVIKIDTSNFLNTRPKNRSFPIISKIYQKFLFFSIIEHNDYLNRILRPRLPVDSYYEEFLISFK